MACRSLESLKIALCFGGASSERNISLDSTRSFYDSIRAVFRKENLFLLYLSPQQEFYAIAHQWIYCNTIEDFEQLLHRPLSPMRSIRASTETSPPPPQESPPPILTLGEKICPHQWQEFLTHIDIMVPLVHGSWGEDGWLTQFLLERVAKSPPTQLGIVGSAPQALTQTFYKDKTKRILTNHGFPTAYGIKLTQHHRTHWHAANPSTQALQAQNNDLQIIQKYFKRYFSRQEITATPQLPPKLVIKPNTAGSSAGISLVPLEHTSALKTAVTKAFALDDEILLEVFIRGQEFSTIVTETLPGHPLAFLPIEIVPDAKLPPASTVNIPQPSPPPADRHSAETAKLYTRTKKYLPQLTTHHHAPARFPSKWLQRIVKDSQAMFKLFAMHDWARIDGFLVAHPPKTKGTTKQPSAVEYELVWTEINSIPGYGMDGLVFQQSTLWNISNTLFSMNLLDNARRRAGIALAEDFNTQLLRKITPPPAEANGNHQLTVAILGGGESSERQVSRMSWFNVIEKLHSLRCYHLRYLFMDKKQQLWEVPRFLTLKHTVEELEAVLVAPHTYAKTLQLTEALKPKLPSQAFFNPWWNESAHNFIPYKQNLAQLAKEIDFLFIALHGGSGENGTLQARLEALHIPFNGSKSIIAAQSSDKYLTQQAIQNLNIPNVTTARSYSFTLKHLYQAIHIALQQANIPASAYEEFLTTAKIDLANVAFNRAKAAKSERQYSNQTMRIKAVAEIISTVIYDWVRTLQTKLATTELVFKPRADGCSTAVWVLRQNTINPERSSPVFYYFVALLAELNNIPYHFLTQAPTKLASYAEEKESLPLPEINEQHPSNLALNLLAEEYISGAASIEMTIGVLTYKSTLIALYPSQSVVEDDILTLEEKFHKGIGINLTPPPEFSPAEIAYIRTKIQTLAQKLGITSYARIDFFYHKPTQTITIIEVNNLPGLTVATVLYTQLLLTPQTQLEPAAFLKTVIEEALPRNVVQ